jgi:hypothetical protein
MILTEIPFESGGYILFMPSKLLNQKELWQNENWFLLSPFYITSFYVELCYNLNCNKTGIVIKLLQNWLGCKILLH